MPRVAIIQNRVILGGRLSVILSIAEVLNRRGITPDIITCGAPSESVIRDRYSQRAEFRIVRIPAPPLPTDLDIWQFNRRVGSRLDGYDLVINTSNSLACLDQNAAPLIHYVFYPRKRRAESSSASIHIPERTIRPLSPKRLTKALARRMYRNERISGNTFVVAISEFVRDAIREDFDVPDERLSIIYPPIDIARFDPSRQRRPHVTTLGRFQPYKRQLDQARIARDLPDLDFSIVGFITSQGYFDQCKRFCEESGADNVNLVASASSEETRELLETSQFFMHNVVDEPFGLTTVEAIAAGCVPVVHDSGGQREVVPDECLRFSTPQEAIDRLRRLQERDDLPAINESLRSRAAELFSAEAFRLRLDETLDAFL